MPTADGQSRADEALIAAREVGGAGGAAEEKEQEVRGRQVGTVAEHGGHDRVSRGGGERTAVAGQAQPTGDAEQVSIDRQRIGGLRGENQHAGRGLVPDSGQAGQVLHRLRGRCLSDDLGEQVRALSRDPAGGCGQPTGLVRPGRPDDLCQVAFVQAGEQAGCHAAAACFQARVDLADDLSGPVLRQHGQDECLERVGAHDDHALEAAAHRGQDRVAVQVEGADLARELLPQRGGQRRGHTGGQGPVGAEPQSAVVCGDGDLDDHVAGPVGTVPRRAAGGLPGQRGDLDIHGGGQVGLDRKRHDNLGGHDRACFGPPGAAGIPVVMASAAMMPVSAAALRLAVYPAALPVTYSPSMSVLCQPESTGTW